LYGLDAITANNGWHMAALGISIVFTGLILLSFTVAQLHNILRLFDNRDACCKKIRGLFKKNNNKQEVGDSDLTLPNNIKEAAGQCKLLIERIGEPFSLPRLIELSEKCGMSHPCSTINDLILAGFIVPDGKGYYVWNQDDQNRSGA